MVFLFHFLMDTGTSVTFLLKDTSECRGRFTEGLGNKWLTEIYFGKLSERDTIKGVQIPAGAI